MPAFSFDDRTGRLHLEGESEAVQFLPWPGMLAFRQRRGSREWVGCRPDLPLLAHPDVTLRRFCASVPDRAREAVAPFPSHHWHLLAWMARAGSAGEDLALANPALAFMLASAESFDRARDPSGARRSWAYLLLGKQVRSLDRLGFPATEQSRRIVRKIAHGALTVERLLALRARLRRAEDLKRLSHLPRINGTVLEISAAGLLERMTPRLLSVLATEAADADLEPAQVLSDTVRMWRQLRRGPEPVFHSVRRLRDEHDTLVDELNLRVRSSGARFPLPPFAGTDDIVPILTMEDLIAEGREQHNCVVSLTSQIRGGSIALYRVLAPERCTLSLSRRRGAWSIDQLKTSCNRPPKRATREAVVAWLRQQVAHASRASPTT